MVTGTHTCIHLRNNEVWSTLQVIPSLHDELLNRCEHHLVYLGFGIFLCLKRCPPVDINVNILPFLGQVMSDDPTVIAQLTLACIKEEGKFPGITQD